MYVIADQSSWNFRYTPNRVECILQLKADTEAAAVTIRGSNERRAELQRMKEEEHEAEKNELFTKGLNPYKASETELMP